MEDISHGLERTPIKCEVNSASCITLPKFRYITRSIPGPECDVESFTEQLAGCDCHGSCDTKLCPCITRFGQSYNETTRQLLPASVSRKELKPVFECNSQCKCHKVDHFQPRHCDKLSPKACHEHVKNEPQFAPLVHAAPCTVNCTDCCMNEGVKASEPWMVRCKRHFEPVELQFEPNVSQFVNLSQKACHNRVVQNGLQFSCHNRVVQNGLQFSCHNRVVQNGLQFELRVKNTGGRGFGLFTCQDIKQLKFVCEYAGEVVGISEARKRLQEMKDGVNYLIILREHCTSGIILTCIDPRYEGNVGRFANHSCNPNMIMVPVRVDNNVPRLALFARRDIHAGEELTFDYSGDALFETENSQAKVNPIVHAATGTVHSTSGCMRNRVKLSQNLMESCQNVSYHSEATVKDDDIDISMNETSLIGSSQTEFGCSQKWTENCLENVSDHCKETVQDEMVKVSRIKTLQESAYQNNLQEILSDSNTVAKRLSFSDASLSNQNVRKRKLAEFESSHSGKCRSTAEEEGGSLKRKLSVCDETGTNVSVDCSRKPCLCRSHNCKGYLPYDELVFSCQKISFGTCL